MQKISYLAVCFSILFAGYLLAADNVPVIELKGHTGEVKSAEFSFDGKKIVTTGEDTIACIWDAHSGKKLRTLKSDTGGLSFAFFSLNGNRVVTKGFDGTQIWDADSGKEIQISGLSDRNRRLSSRTRVQTADVYLLDVSKDRQKMLVAAPQGNQIVVVDTHSGERLTKLAVQANEVASALFVPDGKKIVSMGFGGPRVWDADSGRELQQLQFALLLFSAVFSPDGKKIVTRSGDNTAQILDADTGKELQKLEVFPDAFSPDGKKLVACEDRIARIWDADSGKELKKLAGHTGNLCSAVFSPDGKTIITASEDNTARIWDTDSGKELRTIPIISSNVSPDAQKIVTVGAGDKVARIVNAVDSEKEAAGLSGHTELVGHTGIVWTAVFSPDGKKILTTSEDKTVRIWDVRSGKELIKLEEHDGFYSADFSPDGKEIVTRSRVGVNREKTITWDADSGEGLRATLSRGDSGKALCANFSPDGKKIATIRGNGTVLIWDAESEKKLVEFGASPWNFSPDGKKMVTASSDGTVRIWTLP